MFFFPVFHQDTSLLPQKLDITFIKHVILQKKKKEKIFYFLN